MTDGNDRRSILVGDPEIRAHAETAIDEELQGFECGDGSRRVGDLFRIGQRQRRHAIGLFAGDAECFAAACEDRDLWASPNENMQTPASIRAMPARCVERSSAAAEIFLKMFIDRLEKLPFFCGRAWPFKQRRR